MLNAAMHYQLDYADLSLILALVRGGSLARAAALLCPAPVAIHDDGDVAGQGGRQRRRD